MSELPRGWSHARLVEIVVPRGERVSPKNHKDARFVGLEHVEAHTTRILGTIPASQVKSSASAFRAGDVLYGRLRPYLNKVAKPDFDGLASAEFIVFPDQEHLRSGFLKHRLNASDFVSFASRLNAGDRPRVDFEQIGDFAVLLPPPKEQQRIAEKLEELLSDLDAGIAALERARANLKRYRGAVLKAAVEGRLTEKWRAAHTDVAPAEKLLQRILAERRMKWEEAQLKRFAAKGQAPSKGWKDRYSEPVGPDVSLLPALPGGWCWAAVGQVAEVQGGIQKQPNRAPKGNAFPYLRVGNVLRDRLDLSRMERFELTNEELLRLRLEPGDLLVVEGNGSRNEIGRSALWRGEIENCVHQNHIIRVRFLAGLPEYLNVYWNSPSGMARVFAKSASTSGLYTLSVGKVSELPIPLPPLMEQSEIVSEVAKYRSNLEHDLGALEAMAVRSDRLRQSILRRAFEGKLVPQDPKDEPAIELLARIRAGSEVGKESPRKGFWGGRKQSRQ